MRFYFRFILSFIAIFIVLTQSFSQRTRLKDRNRAEAGITPVAPDYSKMHSWASHPTIHDMGDSIPAPLRKAYSCDSTIDVFFIHPTTYIQKEDGQMNADVNNEYLNRRTDARTILNQASAFNEYRLFAPRYRQANYSAYLSFMGGYQ